MRAGERTERVSLERLQKDQNGDEDWFPIATDPDPWAAVEHLGGNAYAVRLDWRTDLTSMRDCEPAMRVTHVLPSGKIQILDVEDVEPVLSKEVRLLTRDLIVDAPALATGGARIKGG